MAERSRKNEKRRRHNSQIIEIDEAQKRRKEKRARQVRQETAQVRREKVQTKAPRPNMSLSKKLAVCGVLVIAVLVLASSGYRVIDLNMSKAVYENRYEEKLVEKARLEKELSHVDDPEYIEQQARNRFRMLREGEILYVFPEKAPVEAL